MTMKSSFRSFLYLIALAAACLACLILLAESQGGPVFYANLIYSLSLCGLYVTSTIYHCHHWSQINYLRMKVVDHAAIFVLIAGTATPICLFSLKGELRVGFLVGIWIFALIGMLMTLFWRHAPKWLRAFVYLCAGWLALSCLTELELSLGFANTWLLLVGGLFYTIGASVYAFKWPDPYPKRFGYHEIFHLYVVIASTLHFAVIYKIST